MAQVLIQGLYSELNALILNLKRLTIRLGLTDSYIHIFQYFVRHGLTSSECLQLRKDVKI